jgi:hypothetical protein
MTELVAKRLRERSWSLGVEDAPSSTLTFESKPIQLPTPTRWWEKDDRYNAELHFAIQPTDADGGASATVWVGLTFSFDHRVRPSEAWMTSLSQATLTPELQGESEYVDRLGAYESLAALISAQRTAGSQAEAIAAWIESRVDVIASVGPPASKRPSPTE